MRCFFLKAFMILQTTLIFGGELPSEKPYITGQLLGGTGNMLFQIAATCAVAWDNDAEAYFPDLSAKPTLYQHVFSRCKMMPPSSEISVERGEEFPIRFEPKMRLQGYFQAEKYFAPHREKLLKLFAPSTRDLNYIQKNYGWLIDQPNTVGIQLRYYRREVVDGYPQYGKRYLEKAMAMFPETTLFIVSSDNLDYARSNIPSWAKNVVFIENEPHYIDFFLLSLCKNNIISNSSFGWWGAWLNQNEKKMVICPSLWTIYSTEDIFPKDWIRIDAEPEDL